LKNEQRLVHTIIGLIMEILLIVIVSQKK